MELLFNKIGEKFNLKKDTIDYNKELIYSGFFAVLGAPLFGYLMSLFTSTPEILSLSAMLGSVVGSSGCWIVLRIVHGKRRGDISIKKFFSDVAYHTPFATAFGLITNQPLLFFISWSLLKIGVWIVPAAIIAQIISYGVYVAAMNLYRNFLAKHKGKRL